MTETTPENMRRTLLVLFAILCLAPSGLLAADRAQEELAEFARDRPAAGVFLQNIPEVVTFLLQAFRGAYTSVPLDWQRDEPQGNAYAENTPNDDNTFIMIRVSAKLNPQDQVAALVYECRNAQNEKKFAQLISDAYLGKLPKQEFIRDILRLEHAKMKETRAFLAPIQPFRDLDPAGTEFYRKMLGTPEGFEEFIAYLHLIKRPEYDVFAMYSRFYDFLTVTPKQRKAELDAAVQEAEAEEIGKEDDSPARTEDQPGGAAGDGERTSVP